MLPFRINLIRSQTLPPAARRRILAGLIGYLALCGCLLIVASHRASLIWMDTQQKRGQIDLLKQNFLAQYPGEPDVARYGQLLTRQLNYASGQMETIVSLFNRRVQTARIIWNLSRQLPEGMDLVNLKMDTTQKTIDFSLAVPAVGSGESSDNEHLLAAWNGDPELMRQVGRINSVKSQRQLLDGVSVYLLSFSSAIQ